MKGLEKEREEPDVIIDINVSSYIPDEYIEASSQKIEVYQNIALSRTKEDIENIIEDITDRFGKPPKEVLSLIDIAQIKEMCKSAGIIKIAQKENSIVFNFEPDLFNLDIDKLVKRHKDRIKFSSSIRPYITYKLENSKEVIEEIKEFLNGNNK
jgi:transcription-repair coupling factor (superfamily II helicase)